MYQRLSYEEEFGPLGEEEIDLPHIIVSVADRAKMREIYGEDKVL